MKYYSSLYTYKRTRYQHHVYTIIVINGIYSQTSILLWPLDVLVYKVGPIVMLCRRKGLATLNTTA